VTVFERHGERGGDVVDQAQVCRQVRRRVQHVE
jgi:hypothetical protein